MNLTAAQLDDINKLHNEFRNNFEYFAPNRCHRKEQLPRITSTAIDCTEILMGHSEVLFRLTGNRKRRLASTLKSLRTALTRIKRLQGEAMGYRVEGRQEDSDELSTRGSEERSHCSRPPKITSGRRWRSLDKVGTADDMERGV